MDTMYQDSQLLVSDKSSSISLNLDLEQQSPRLESALSLDSLSEINDVRQSDSNIYGKDESAYKHEMASTDGSSSPECPVSMHALQEEDIYASRASGSFSSLPLLSPFVATERDQSRDTHGAQIAHLGHSLIFPPSSPSTVSPQSSSPANLASPFTAGPLQSPFIGSNQSVSSTLRNVSHIESPETFSPWASVPAVNATDIEIQMVESREINSSETLEKGSTHLPSTPTTLPSVSVNVDADANMSMKENAEEPKQIVSVSEQVICTSVDDVTSDDVIEALVLMASNENNEAKSLLLGSPLVVALTEDLGPGSLKPAFPRLISFSQAPAENEQVAPATISSEMSTPTKYSQESTQSSGSQPKSEKRPFESNDLSQPAPKRMTLASQKKQHQKLSTPFRSPLLSKSNLGNVGTPDRSRAKPSRPSPISSSPRRNSDEERPSTPLKAIDRSLPATLPRSRPLKAGPSKGLWASSAKATSQFKSPIMSSFASSSFTPSRVNSSRTTQKLEREVQLLKRAIKITRDNDEEKLKQLVKKWKEAGREAAWELWQIVRDNDESSDAPYPGTNSKSSGGMFSGSWGWADSSSEKRSGIGNGSNGRDNWGWDAPLEAKKHEDNDDDDSELESPSKLENKLYQSLSKKPVVPRSSMLPPTPRGAYYEQQRVETDQEVYPHDDCGSGEGKEEEDKEDQDSSKPLNPSKSLGTMLLQIGIAHETLGWVEDEGDFVDS
ncbi:hypothetical protein DFH11DRAFT_1601556 [Phellopilus nigrolimitatus]|nr:hypothetical protein DFH11DRAFT_1601556 [Phellopilus nigrolimitatus]